MLNQDWSLFYYYPHQLWECKNNNTILLKYIVFIFTNSIMQKLFRGRVHLCNSEKLTWRYTPRINRVIIFGEILDTAIGPFVFPCSIIHIPTNISTRDCFGWKPIASVFIIKIVIHSKIVANFMGYILEKDNAEIKKDTHV